MGKYPLPNISLAQEIFSFGKLGVQLSQRFLFLSAFYTYPSWQLVGIGSISYDYREALDERTTLHGNKCSYSEYLGHGMPFYATVEHVK